jgi:hypothetical protein
MNLLPIMIFNLTSQEADLKVYLQHMVSPEVIIQQVRQINQSLRLIHRFKTEGVNGEIQSLKLMV